MFNLDQASHAGLKYASVLLLFAELLKMFIFADSDNGHLAEDMGAVIALLGPMAQSFYD